MSRFSSEYSFFNYFQLLYVLPSISHNSTDYAILTTPPRVPVNYDLIISDLIDSDLDLHIKLDAL